MKNRRKVYKQEIRDLFKYHKEKWISVKEIWEMLQVPYNTIKEWNTKYRKWKEIKDSRIWNSTKQKKFLDEELRNYCESHENATLKEIWEHFWVTLQAIYNRFQIIWYSYKKKNWNIKKEMKTKEKYIKKK